MSTLFFGHFDANVPGANARWLLDELDTELPLLIAVAKLFPPHWGGQTWTVEASGATGEEELVGPGGFYFRFDHGTIEVCHLVSFTTFARDSDVRIPLRRVWQYIAGLVGSTRAIYTHELMPCVGASLKEMEADLRATFGPPALNFEELHRAEFFGPRAWYIDDFHDLIGSPSDRP